MGLSYSENQSKLESLSFWERMRQRSPKIRNINAVAIVLAGALALIALNIDNQVFIVDEQLERGNADYVACSQAAYELQLASNYLTSEFRLYVFTGEREHLNNYLYEINEADNRGNAVKTLEARSKDAQSRSFLSRALRLSNELAEMEYYAMRLTADAYGETDMPPEIARVQLTQEDSMLDAESKRQLAEQIAFGESYTHYKDQIEISVSSCANTLVGDLSDNTHHADEELRYLLGIFHIVVLLLLFSMVFVIFTMIFFVLWPIATYSYSVKNVKPLDAVGSFELRYLANSYNDMYDQVQEKTQRLEHEAETDPLTGLLNRGVYDEMISDMPQHSALMIADIDYFKDFNDKFGHGIGDKVLKKVAQVISSTFRATDNVFRIGGDEFAVIMADVNPDLKDVVEEKLKRLAFELAKTDDELPPVTLSIGVAFSDSLTESMRIYPAADTALYKVKREGRNGFAFYEKDMK